MDHIRRTCVEILGWYGLIAVVIAYGSVSLSFISPNTYVYQFLNLSGSVGLGLVAFVKRAYQNGVLNVVWGAIAVLALIRLIL
ncbi:MAG: CBU_0592 family membrane protein [Candidatus Bathyarchaeia archaeon]